MPPRSYDQLLHPLAPLTVVMLHETMTTDSQAAKSTGATDVRLISHLVRQRDWRSDPEEDAKRPDMVSSFWIQFEPPLEQESPSHSLLLSQGFRF